MSLIEAEGLSFRYPRARPGEPPFALALPSWRVEPGERVALFGPSGCGKSTLLNLVAGILTVSAGTLRVAGEELAQLSESRRRALRIRQIGFVFQDFPLVEYLSAEENALFAYRLNTALRLDAAARDRARSLLAQLGLAGKERRRPHELSQGERQRVAIARALVTEPRLLLADEPTAGLDEDRSDAVMDLLERLSRERQLTLLMVTHERRLLGRFDNTLELGASGAAH